MGQTKHSQNGFAVVELLLVAVVIVAVAGIGWYIMKNRTAAPGTTQSSMTASPAKPGTTASIDQLTTKAAQAETDAETSVDAATQQAVNSANTAAANVGGAYNENSF